MTARKKEIEMPKKNTKLKKHKNSKGDGLLNETQLPLPDSVFWGIVMPLTFVFQNKSVESLEWVFKNPFALVSKMPKGSLLSEVAPWLEEEYGIFIKEEFETIATVVLIAMINDSIRKTATK